VSDSEPSEEGRPVFYVDQHPGWIGFAHPFVWGEVDQKDIAVNEAIHAAFVAWSKDVARAAWVPGPIEVSMASSSLWVEDSVTIRAVVKAVPLWRSLVRNWTPGSVGVVRPVKFKEDQVAVTVGQMVLYTLSEGDAVEVNRRRAHATFHLNAHRERADGSQIHVGNEVAGGDVFPMVVVGVEGSGSLAAVNGQVMLDGNDTLWVRLVREGSGPATFARMPGGGVG
jgi:hypothetical protein